MHACRDLEVPVPGEDEVRVRVRAASLNLGDWYAVTGRPWAGRVEMGIRGPKTDRFGTDYAGVVEVVGKNVTVGHMALLHACEVQDGAFIGMRSTVLDGAVVESEAHG